MNKLHFYLNMLQLEEYDPERFWNWIKKHPNPKEPEGKKPLVWTIKAKGFYYLSWLLLPITLVVPWLSLLVLAMIIKPVEMLVIWRLKQKTREKIDRLKREVGLKVVGVAGSYGKTSVKEALYTILSDTYRVYRTPESYNTVKGVAKAVDLELDRNYQIFICEIGEYKPGDVKEICEMIDPDLGIITGVNEQHHERMGGIDNALKTIFELADWVRVKSGKVWANVGDDRIKELIKDQNIFEEYGDGKYKSPLEQNIEGAVKVADYLGMKSIEIKERIKLIKPFKHRLEEKKLGLMTLIDDTYNSNPDGFVAAIEYLSNFPAPRIIVTPGIVELGTETEKIHCNLGEKMNGVVDELILVGKNGRTDNLAATFKGKTTYVESVRDWHKVVNNPKATVLFENDLPDNY